MKKSVSTLAFTLTIGYSLVTNICSAQNIGINTAGATPDASSMLDVVSTNKGLLIPRVALTATNSASPITAPANSLQVYNTATASTGSTAVYPGYYYWDGTKWVAFGGTGSLDWSLLGNAGTVDGTNFIGTTDNIPFNIRVNNQKAGRIDQTLNNTFFGYQAGNATSTGNNNTAIGMSALYSSTTGYENTAYGLYALYSNTTGYHNTANGIQALQFNTTGYENTAIGMFALYKNTTGIYNTANGFKALQFNTTGDENTAIGGDALSLNTTGHHNTANGSQALSSNTTGSFNLAIGYNAQVPNGAANNQVRIGDVSIVYAGIQVAWTITSDKRWKSDIQPSNLGLDFISKLIPVSYIRNNDESKKREFGFIAQDLEEALNTSGASNNGIISKDDKGMYGVRYNDLMAPMVKAIQEQQMQIKTLENENLEAQTRFSIKFESQQAEIEKIKLQLGMEAKAEKGY